MRPGLAAYLLRFSSLIQFQRARFLGTDVPFLPQDRDSPRQLAEMTPQGRAAKVTLIRYAISIARWIYNNPKLIDRCILAAFNITRSWRSSSSFLREDSQPVARIFSLLLVPILSAPIGKTSGNPAAMRRGAG